MYCGRPVRAGERLIVEGVKCPACGHVVVAPEKTPDNAREPVLADRGRREKVAAFWATKSDQEIAECLLPAEVMTEQQRRRRTIQGLFSFLIPRYDDLTLFALGLSFVLLWFMDPAVQQDLIGVFTSPVARDEALVVLVVGAATVVLGMGLSLVNVFFRREKSSLEKFAMLIFAVVVTAGAGFYAGGRLLGQFKGWLLIFPGWNILNAYLLILFCMIGADANCITDEPASFGQLLLTSICVPVLLVVCQYFELHWAVTFSIAAAYTMSLHNGIREVFGGRRPSRGRV